MKILVCDDLPELRKAYARLLRSHGHEVLQAADGQEAFDLLNNEEVDAVISDHNMPRMTGEQLCRALRGIGNQVPFMLISGNMDVVCHAKSFGATRAVLKGINNKEILDFLASTAA